MIGLTLNQQREFEMHDERDLLNLIREEETELPSASILAISGLQESIKECNHAGTRELTPAYNEAIIRLGVEKGWMTYNGLITLAIKLLTDYPRLAEYLRRSFPSIMLDEAQDTNVLHLEFLSHLVDSRTRCCFFGDPSQRIYGFLGALPDFKEKAIQEFELEERSLSTNHRFERGSEMFLLEKQLRKLMKGDTGYISCDQAVLPVMLSSSFLSQCEDVVNLVDCFASKRKGATVAILFNKRSALSDGVCSMLNSRGIDYFDGLFSDDSKEFISVCDKCLRTFNDSLSKESAISSPEAKSILISLSEGVSTQGYRYSKSYGALLSALANRIGAECADMNGVERYQYISDILSTHSLRRYSEFVESKLTVSTIHAAKGLEWDYVIIPGLSKWDFPMASCSSCPQKNSNGIQISGLRVCGPYSRAKTDRLQEQINIWYVALTRARKRVVAVTSYERITQSGNHQKVPISCLLGLPGITPKSLGAFKC
jgi:DNA helicase-2/ATP-dependent DNA helicase PcrA